MPSRPSWYLERDAIATFLRGWPLAPGRRWRLLPTSANAQPAVAEYTWDETAQAFLPQAITLLTLGRSGGEEITASSIPNSSRASASVRAVPVSALGVWRSGDWALRRLRRYTIAYGRRRGLVLATRAARRSAGRGAPSARRARTSVGASGLHGFGFTAAWFYSRIR
jgi:hypothetical protein